MWCYLKEKVPPLANQNFWVGLKTRWPNHLTSQLSSCIKDLAKMAAYSFYGSSPALVDDPKPLIVASNMEEHRHLFLNTRVYIVYHNPLCLNRLHRAKNGALLM
jgi:hypothetical protein